jgi:hypothetical protein
VLVGDPLMFLFIINDGLIHFNAFQLKTKMPSFHILIATVGRDVLQRMLDTILPYLTEIDHLTIVFDGVEPTNINVETKGHVHIHSEPIALGFWGHGIRNKYATLLEKTDFVMHADDDDGYATDAFSVLRNICIDNETLYIGKMKNFDERILPTNDKIVIADIGTPCGIIPYELNKKATWAEYYGGDGSFYIEISKYVANIVFFNNIIYNVRSIS